MPDFILGDAVHQAFVDLYGANLCDANLRGANLRGADLRGANLPDLTFVRALSALSKSKGWDMCHSFLFYVTKIIQNF
ncbi:pentapeptide repeat-containing protein [Salmonella enterica]|nr:pentapeptide repeat-containing protein [Salmonella enterica]